MARETWVYDRELNKMVLKEEYQAKKEYGPFVMSDIEPYQSMITGEMIQGRAQHRAHLKQHNCIEVGNEKLTPPKRKEPTIHDYKRFVADVMASKGY